MEIPKKDQKGFFFVFLNFSVYSVAKKSFMQHENNRKQSQTQPLRRLIVRRCTKKYSRLFPTKPSPV